MAGGGGEAADLMLPDFQAHTWLQGAYVLEGMLEPGDMLFVPEGWVPQVLGVEWSASAAAEYDDGGFGPFGGRRFDGTAWVEGREAEVRSSASVRLDAAPAACVRLKLRCKRACSSRSAASVCRSSAAAPSRQRAAGLRRL